MPFAKFSYRAALSLKALQSWMDMSQEKGELLLFTAIMRTVPDMPRF